MDINERDKTIDDIIKLTKELNEKCDKISGDIIADTLAACLGLWEGCSSEYANPNSIKNREWLIMFRKVLKDFTIKLSILNGETDFSDIGINEIKSGYFNQN